MASFSEIENIAVALAAFIGMVLGIFNFFNERRKERVSLRVVPKTVVQREGGFSLSSTREFNSERNAGMFGIEVVNLSHFPVVLKQVGFLKSGTDRHMTIVNPIVDDGGRWPRKLGSRESVTVYGNLDEMIKTGALHLVRKACVETSCGHIATGHNQALKELIQFGKTLHDNRLNENPWK